MANTGCPENSTGMATFLLLGFHSLPALKPVLFLFFFTMFVLSVSGNLLVVVTTAYDVRLHSPMYFFLGNLSTLDICCTTTIIPTLLGSHLGQGFRIPRPGCIAQLCTLGLFIATECFLLTVMAYDRYVAICHPLRYSTLMDLRFCIYLVIFSWVIGFLFAMTAEIILSMLQFPDQNRMDHFICDLSPLFQLACSETSLTQMVCFFISIIIFSFPCTVLIISYAYIISTILKIPSTTGKNKAFSTCSSHLTIVIAYFGILILMYMVPSAGNANNTNKAFSLLYTVGTPLFNPIVYTLRNKEMKEALTMNLARMCASYERHVSSSKFGGKSMTRFNIQLHTKKLKLSQIEEPAKFSISSKQILP